MTFFVVGIIFVIPQFLVTLIRFVWRNSGLELIWWCIC